MGSLLDYSSLPKRRISRLAITAAGCAVVGIPMVMLCYYAGLMPYWVPVRNAMIIGGWLSLAIASVITGGISASNIRESRGQLSGRWIAITAIVLGVLQIPLAALAILGALTPME